MLTYEDRIENVISSCMGILMKKKSEYATCQDDFRNFNVAANLQNCTPEQALGGMMAKHVSSVYDLIRADEKDIKKWDEKIVDNINYLLMLRVMVGMRLEEERCEDSIEQDYTQSFDCRNSGCIQC